MQDETPTQKIPAIDAPAEGAAATEDGVVTEDGATTEQNVEQTLQMPSVTASQPPMPGVADQIFLEAPSAPLGWEPQPVVQGPVPPLGWQQQPLSQQGRWRSGWRAMVASFVAGGLLAGGSLAVASGAGVLDLGRRASVAQGTSGASSDSSSASDRETSGSGNFDPGNSDSGSPSEPGSSSGSEWTTPGQGGGRTRQGTTASGQTRATSAQSSGVALITTRTSQGQGAGTGMVLTSDGYVLTNYHVVENTTQVKVEIATSGKVHTAKVVGNDPERDVALLKLDDASGLATVKLDDDRDLAVGSRVTAVGNSNGQGYLSAATGQVKDLKTSIKVGDSTSWQGSEDLEDVIQTTAQAVPGDSGGPLFDAEGEVVGMTTAGSQVGGRRTAAVTVASYAVPIERAMSIVQQIRDNDESGTVRVGPKAYLGISVTASSTGRVQVSEAVAGQPAARAGISAGDVIVSIDGAETSTAADVAEALAGRDPGDKVTIVRLDRQGSRHSTSVTLGESPLN